MRLVCISDTHNSHKGLRLPEGDILIHAGDATSQGLTLETERFLGWFSAQPHRYKIFVAGNHDWLFQRHPEMAAQLLAAHPDITYLQDSGIEIEGVKFWGSPWQPWFHDWAFNLPRGGSAIREIWNKIPISTEVLITHGPPHGILDQVRGGTHLGCEELKLRLAAVRPRVHVFGHIHDAYGVARSNTAVYVNGCSCDENYRPTHRPIVLDLNPESVEFHGIEPNQRLESLERIQSVLNETGDGLLEKVPYDLFSTQLRGLLTMAEIRGIDATALLQEYVTRGLQSDLARYLRSENRPSKRQIPHTWLANEHGEQ